jgi:hypothetical protein
MIYMNYSFEDIEYCKPIGEYVNEYVYDVEMQDNSHTFIANNMLVHNSNYISYKPLMDSVGYTGEPIQFILHVHKVLMKRLLNKFLIDYAKTHEVENKHDFELENINKSSLHLGGKIYIKNTLWEEGVFHDSDHNLIPVGVQLIKSSTPPWVRGKGGEGGVWKFINYLFNEDVDKLDIMNILRIVKELKDEFVLQNIEDISMSTSCTNYSTRVIDDVNDVIVKKGSHFSIKASAFHNYLLNKNSEYKTKYDIIRGGQIKYYYCKHNINNVFGYTRSFHPYEITEKEKVLFDYDTQFEKTVLSIINGFLIPIGLPPINKRLAVRTSLFNF